MEVGNVGFSSHYNNMKNSKLLKNQTIFSSANSETTLLSYKATAMYQSNISFGAKSVRLPFKNLIHLNLPCACCGKKMINRERFNLPQQIIPCPADSVLRQIDAHPQKRNKHEIKALNQAKKLVSEAPNMSLIELLTKIENPPQILTAFKSKTKSLTKKEYTESLVNYLETFAPYMHKVEKVAFTEIKAAHMQAPEKSIRELIVSMRPKHIEIIKSEQLPILEEITKKSDNLPPLMEEQVNDLIEQTKLLINQDNLTHSFRKKIFIANLTSILAKDSQSATSQDIINLANSLPSSQNTISAFIVKYSGLKIDKHERALERTSEEIATRLVSPSFVSVDHILALNAKGAIKGENVKSNAIYECVECNAKKANNDLATYIDDPELMTYNAKKQLNLMIEETNKSKNAQDAAYIIDVTNTLNKVSRGKINLVEWVDVRLDVQPLAESLSV